MIARKINVLCGIGKDREEVEFIGRGVHIGQIPFVFAMGRGGPEFGEFDKIVSRDTKNRKGLGETQRECVNVIVIEAKRMERWGQWPLDDFNLAILRFEDLKLTRKKGHVGEMVGGDSEVNEVGGKVMGKLGEVEVAQVERLAGISFLFPFLDFLLDNKGVCERARR